jgi:hypothetical protein
MRNSLFEQFLRSPIGLSNDPSVGIGRRYVAEGQAASGSHSGKGTIPVSITFGQRRRAPRLPLKKLTLQQVYSDNVFGMVARPLNALVPELDH